MLPSKGTGEPKHSPVNGGPDRASFYFGRLAVNRMAPTLENDGWESLQYLHLYSRIKENYIHGSAILALANTATGMLRVPVNLLPETNKREDY